MAVCKSCKVGGKFVTAICKSCKAGENFVTAVCKGCKAGGKFVMVVCKSSKAGEKFVMAVCKSCKAGENLLWWFVGKAGKCEKKFRRILKKVISTILRRSVKKMRKSGVREKNSVILFVSRGREKIEYGLYCI